MRDAPGSWLTTDRAVGGALIAVALFVTLETRRLPVGSVHDPGPGYFPLVLSGLVALFGTLLIVSGGDGPALASAGWSRWRQPVAVFATCVVAALALERLGYRLTMTAALLFLLAVVERKGLLVSAVLAVGLAFGSFYLFSTVLRVPLPLGPWAL
jgi:putative tricarboxylic transport membrane protein